MSTTQLSNERTTPIPSTGKVDMKLEVVVIPVSDVDRAKRFYLSMGWRLGRRFRRGDSWRVRAGDASGLGVLFLLRQGTHEGNAGLRSGTAPHGR